MNNLESLELLQKARTVYSQREIASLLGVDARTVRRWEAKECEPPTYITDAIRQRILQFQSNRKHSDGSFKFIDLFAGIGGIRLGFERQGGHCVFTSEWNNFAQKTYLANFPETADHSFAGDITQVHVDDIPDHDVLLAGFPCQPFSIAGVSKKNALGRPHGFECATQGTLFFDVARIIAAKRPKAFLLENVKNLLSHDKGNTFQVILQTLHDELGYEVHYKVIDGQHFVPQHRERIIIVGFREGTNFSWEDLQLPKADSAPRMKNILHPQDGSESPELPYTEGTKAKVNEKYTLTPKLWDYLQAYAAKHKAAGNGFGFGLVTGDSVSRTLSARYYKDGSEILVSQGTRKRPRRLTPRECARLMGYPDSFKITVSDTQAYKQFGNSVIVPVMEEVARIMVPRIHAITKSEHEDSFQIGLAM
ncbi:DNA (cytosine-5-)-methyltransferase [Pseudohongiella spirulinae]|uniref:Cytosine-specific methyltransferase n=1 Tax=Pseudohongiella spirulinae TaxID=1249552 RepID=A0A0S2KH26_9GAMM|nr:DNA (cytosine-5-)-methyltransferase [Pseudohongiella spirulinae]ALO47613.1 Cytosine-specific methyltransferase [Pseudohongiella spirulinae]